MSESSSPQLDAALLERALDARRGMLSPGYDGALRLFNGFYEGFPSLAADLYARTLVLFNYADPPEKAAASLETARRFYHERLPGIDCVLCKERSSPDPLRRRGRELEGSAPAEKVNEAGVWYALDLLMNQDASLYLDTRGLRAWLLERAAGWTVLNTFAYTGSLGTAALAGGAVGVVQVDRSQKFLSLARLSCELNALDDKKMKLRAADFFSEVSALKHASRLFDCVIVDPPFFSSTEKGTVNLVEESRRVINKVRPLVRDGGWLVSINNALFLSGAEYRRTLDELCADGYLSLEEILPVPPDFTGFESTVVSAPPADPAPFNHSTKIAVLRVKRKG